MTWLEVLFWLAVAGLGYVYLGYPLILFFGSRWFPRPVRKAGWEPEVTILIAAFNEERWIRQTIENKLALDYPRERLQLVIVSDGSTDRTAEIAATSQGERVMVVQQQPRNGKSAALNLGATHATGEILVFADANSLYQPEALRRLVANFADPSVGYVTGKLRYANPDGTMTGDGCGAYMKYENFVRVSETTLGSVVGVNGGIDAVRRDLFQPFHPDDLPDLVLPLRVAAQGYRVVYEPEALVTETANADPSSEYRMRVRVSLRALWTLSDMRNLLSIRRHGLFAIQLLSHKVLRYLAFAFLPIAFVTSALLWTSGWIYQVAFLGQVALAITGLMGLAAERRGYASRMLSFPYYFGLVNLAALHALILFVRRQRHRTWQPRLG